MLGYHKHLLESDFAKDAKDESVLCLACCWLRISNIPQLSQTSSEFALPTLFHRMILCLATDDSRSSTCMSMKYGATLKVCRHLLETAKEMNVEVVGIR